jgi:hypothetical protein
VKRFLFSFLIGLAALASCSSDKSEYQPPYQHVVIVGNSITRHPAKPEIGWNNDWGMAASAREKDFVHLLINRFQQKAPGAQVKFQNIAEWERTYWKYDLSRLDTVKTFKPDLLIVRLGENVQKDSVAIMKFQTYFPQLLDRLASDSTRIVVASSFWPGNPAIAVMKQVCEQRGVTYLALDHLDADPKNKALGLFADPGVAIHPSDQGMQAIADAIWDKI